MRESRTLRAMWRALETGPRHLLNGHEEGNLGYKPRRCLRAAAPVLDPTWVGRARFLPSENDTDNQPPSTDRRIFAQLDNADRAHVPNELGKPVEDVKHLCNRLTANSVISRADRIIA